MCPVNVHLHHLVSVVLGSNLSFCYMNIKRLLPPIHRDTTYENAPRVLFLFQALLIYNPGKYLLKCAVQLRLHTFRVK